MRGLYCVTFLLAACRGDADGVGSPDNGSRHQLRGYPRFTCHLGGAHELRLGVIADRDFISYQRDGEEGFKREVRQLVQDASVVYNEQLGFLLSIEHLVLPSAFPNNDFLENRSFCYNDTKRKSDFNEFRKVYLADKPAGLWFLWTTCLRLFGMVSRLSNVCTKESPIGIVTSMNRRRFIHEVGHSFGALHPPPPETIDQVDVMVPGNFPIIHFKVRHESGVCDVLHHSLHKIDIGEMTEAAVAQREEMLNLDLCWKIPSGAQPRDHDPTSNVGPKTTRLTNKKDREKSKTFEAGKKYDDLGLGLCASTAGRVIYVHNRDHSESKKKCETHCSKTPKCSGFSYGGNRCYIYDSPQLKLASFNDRNGIHHCMVKRGSKTQKEVGRQPETNTVQTGQPQSHQPKAGRQPGRQSNPGDAPDCSKLEPGWASCEKQNAGCKTHYYPPPKMCVSTTSGNRSAEVQADKQESTSTVVAILCGGAVLVAIGAAYACYAMNRKKHEKRVKHAGRE